MRGFERDTHTHTHTQSSSRLHESIDCMHSPTLQGIATRCNTLQHTATHTRVLRKYTRKTYNTATHCNTLRHTATHCNTLQHTATHCKRLHHAHRPRKCHPQTCNTGSEHTCAESLAAAIILQHTATRCNTHTHLESAIPRHARLGVSTYLLDH